MWEWTYQQGYARRPSRHQRPRKNKGPRNGPDPRGAGKLNRFRERLDGDFAESQGPTRSDSWHPCRRLTSSGAFGVPLEPSGSGDIRERFFAGQGRFQHNFLVFFATFSRAFPRSEACDPRSHHKRICSRASRHSGDRRSWPTPSCPPPPPRRSREPVPRRPPMPGKPHSTPHFPTTTFWPATRPLISGAAGMPSMPAWRSRPPTRRCWEASSGGCLCSFSPVRGAATA